MMNWFMKKADVILVALLAIFIMSSCMAKSNHAQKLPEIQVIHYMGSGWTDWHEKMIIKNDGTIMYEKQEPFGGDYSEKTIQLPSDELLHFQQLINEADVFSFQENYFDEEHFVTDLPTHYFIFTINGRKKTVSMYLPESHPDILNQIIRKVRAMKRHFD